MRTTLGKSLTDTMAGHSLWLSGRTMLKNNTWNPARILRLAVPHLTDQYWDIVREREHRWEENTH